MITCDLDITPTPFSNTTIIANENELSPVGKKIGLNILDDEDFTIPYVTYKKPNSPTIHRITT